MQFHFPGTDTIAALVASSAPETPGSLRESDKGDPQGRFRRSGGFAGGQTVKSEPPAEVRAGRLDPSSGPNDTNDTDVAVDSQLQGEALQSPNEPQDPENTQNHDRGEHPR